MKPDDFGYGTGGATAGLNSLRFFTCPECGACVTETDQSVANRRAHILWHLTETVIPMYGVNTP